MVCPKCLHEKTEIYNSRFTRRNNQTWRRRRCKHCGFTFSTREYIEADQYLQVTGTNGKVTPFSRTQLLLALARATAHHPSPDAAFYLLGGIENKLLQISTDGTVSPVQIIATCLHSLRAFDTKAYLKYLAEHPDIADKRDLKKLLKQA